jgi:hypothetical protein
MPPFVKFASIAAISSVLASPALATTKWAYVIIAVPSASSTVVNAINATATIAGCYYDSSNNQYAFTFSNYVYTKLSPPGGTAACATSVAADGTVVGTFLTNSGNYAGFTYKGGTYTTVAPFNESDTVSAISANGIIAGNAESYFGDIATFTVTNGVAKTVFSQGYYATPVAVNNAGAVLGNFTTASDAQEGFLVSGPSTSLITLPNGSAVHAAGLNNSNLAVGSFTYSPDKSTRGFTYSKGAITEVLAPGNSQTTFTGVNDNGIIIGAAWSASNPSLGFSLLNGAYSTFAPIPGISTMPTAISPTNAIVGNLGNKEAFLAIPLN